jgi:hypothetical protein
MATTGSDSHDRGREDANQLDLGDAMGDEEGVVRSVEDEDAEEPRKESQDDVLGIGDDDDDDEEDAGESGGGVGALQAKQGGDDLRGRARCLPFRFRRSSSLHSISTSSASRRRSCLRCFGWL